MGMPEENHPDSLWQICLEYCVSNLDTFCVRASDVGLYTLRPGLTLPAEICESLIRASVEGRHDTGDAFFHIFRDTVHTHLKRLSLRDSMVTDRSLGWLIAHRPVELDVSRCVNLKRSCRRHLKHHGDRLQALLLGQSWEVILDPDQDVIDGEDLGHMVMESSPSTHTSSSSPPAGSVSRAGDGSEWARTCPHLRAFSIHGVEADVKPSFLTELITPLMNLTYLDLSRCRSPNVEDMECISQFQQLMTLILYDVPLGEISVAFTHLRALKSLR